MFHEEDFDGILVHTMIFTVSNLRIESPTLKQPPKRMRKDEEDQGNFSKHKDWRISLNQSRLEFC